LWVGGGQGYTGAFFFHMKCVFDFHNKNLFKTFLNPTRIQPDSTINLAR
jgi:hypothetical protein